MLGGLRARTLSLSVEGLVTAGAVRSKGVARGTGAFTLFT